MDTSQENTLYPYVFDHKPGLFLSRLLYTLFKKVSTSENMIEVLRQMHKKGTVVYAIKYRGQLDYLGPRAKNNQNMRHAPYFIVPPAARLSARYKSHLMRAGHECSGRRLARHKDQPLAPRDLRQARRLPLQVN